MITFASMQDYLGELNDKQREAVTTLKGPLMIVAGAGSGKTKVLTTRIAHLMNHGVDAFRILALTFTNKAAKEMKERVEHILGNQDARSLFIGTFHSIFARILRYEADKLGYPNNFTIYDTEDAKSIIKSIVKSMNLDEKLYKPSIVYNRISAAKNNLYTYKEYQEDYAIQEEDTRSKRPDLGIIFEKYSKQCFKNGAMDFDDLLVNMFTLLKNHLETLAKYQHRFQYILIDEYQDTNLAQYHIIKLLGAMHENICVVGDDAQSIYSFRGASMRNIFQFQKDYDDVKIIKLEQNYRSTQNILHAANSVINQNQNQIKKELWTENGNGNLIKIVSTFTDNDEGKWVTDSIAENKLRYHVDNKDMAILYRTNAQSRAFEEHLRRANIPYRIYGGISFYQRKEIKDFIAYLRIIVNPRDEENFKRIINYPARGIGNTTLQKVQLAAAENEITFWDVIQKPAQYGLTGSSVQKLEAFSIMIKSFQSLLQKKNAYEIADEVGKVTGIIKLLYNEGSVEDLARYENIQELLNSIKEFTETPDEEGELAEKDLGAYLQQITLLTDADTQEPENQNVVTLMTVHSAKGLEFQNVYVVGAEENLFPSSMSLYDREDLEEERRLFYVALTRAKENVWITYAGNRYRFGKLESNEPSRFIDELPEKNIDTGLVQKRRVPNFFRPGGDSVIESKKVEKSPYQHQTKGSFVPDNPEEMTEGMKVEHQRFGFGNILQLEGSPANRIATIHFDIVGKKKIMLNFAKIRIVNT